MPISTILSVRQSEVALSSSELSDSFSSLRGLSQHEFHPNICRRSLNVSHRPQFGLQLPATATSRQLSLRLQFFILWSIWSQLNRTDRAWYVRSLVGLVCNTIYLVLLCVHSATAQNLTPLPPDRPSLPQPQPLPPSNNPLNDLEAPPLPESVLDIPGTIVVEQFVFAGNTAFEDEELNRSLADFTGKPISFAQLIVAANAITKLYVDRGYITSGAYLPEQNLESGIVQIQVVEGTLAEIETKITGVRLSENYIRNRLIYRIGTPLNIKELQSALQQLQSNPLVESLNAELATGIEPGTNFLTVSVVGADTFRLRGRLNNNRNLSIGTFERGISLEEANLSGIGDRFSVAYYNTDGSNQYEASYTLPLNARDGSLRFDYRLTQNQIVQSSFADLDLEVKSRNYDLTWQQPILQQATSEVNRELTLSVTASRRESDAFIDNFPQPLSVGADNDGEIRTSILSFAQEWLQRDRQQVISARSQFNFGLDAFNATTLNEEPNSQFFSWRGQISYLRLLNSPTDLSEIGSTIAIDSQLQLSADPLISTEQFSLGGANSVRGYLQDALLTDNGFLVSAELRLPVARLNQLNTTIHVSPFIDFGTGWNADLVLEDKTLLATGFGVLLQSPDRLSARVDWGIPLLERNSEDSSLQGDGIYFQLEYDFL